MSNRMINFKSLSLYNEFKDKSLSSKKNPHLVPSLKKIVLHMRFSSKMDDKKSKEAAMNELFSIALQKPVFTYAKNAISSFSIVKKDILGCKVTLRRSAMYNFLDKLIYIALPRVRDFNGFKFKSIDNTNNFVFGLSDHTIFPEINYDNLNKTRGLDIIFDIESKSKEDTFDILKSINVPIKK